MDTAASALSEQAKGAASSSKEDDEWDIFGRVVANSIRAIKSEDQQNLLFKQLYFKQQNMQCNSKPASLQQLQIYTPALTYMKAMALITITLVCPLFHN